MDNEEKSNEPKGKIIKLPISQETEDKRREYAQVERIRNGLAEGLIRSIPRLLEEADKLENKKILRKTMKSVRQLIFQEAKKKGITPREMAKIIDQGTNSNRCQNLLLEKD